MKYIMIISTISLFSTMLNAQEAIIDKGYYENGQLEFKKRYVSGEKDGQQLWWYRNGQLEFEQNYLSGKKDGLWKGWWSNGQLEYQGEFQSDKRDGLWEAYYDNGQLRKKADFVLERKVRETCFDEKGTEIKCDDVLNSVWWWKPEMCFDKNGLQINCDEFYFGAF